MSFDLDLTGKSETVMPSAARYEVHEDVDETWQIIDTASGLPAASDGRELVHLARMDAIELAKELNDCEVGGGESPLL